MTADECAACEDTGWVECATPWCTDADHGGHCHCAAGLAPQPEPILDAWIDEVHEWGSALPPVQFRSQYLNGVSTASFAPIGTPLGSPAWINLGHVIEGFEWSAGSDTDLEDVPRWNTADLNEWKIELKVDWVNPSLVNLVMGPHYAYSHPIPLKGGSEYHRRRRNR